MSLRVGEIHTLLDLEDREFQRGMKRAERTAQDVERSLQGVTRRLDNMGKQMQATGRAMTTRITLPLIAAGAAAVKFASDMAATHDLLNDTFREGSDAAREFGHDMADAMGRSKQQMEDFLATTQGIFAPLLEQRELAGELSKSVAALAVDLGSFYNVADRDALSALHSGLLGMSEPLRRFGVVINESTLEQERLRLGIDRTTQEMTEQERVLLRYSLVMRQTSDAQGDAISTIGEFDNQLKVLTADVSNLAVEIGHELLPYGFALVQWARDIIKHFRDLSPEAKEMGIQIAMLAAAAGPAAIAFGGVVRAIAATGRALRALTVMAQRNPWVLLGTAAAVAVLSIEDVRKGLNDLAREAGLGDLMDELEDFQATFEELLDFDIAFDVEGANEEALARLEQQQAETMERMRKAIAEGLGGVADTAGDGATEVVDRIAQAFERFETDARVRQMMNDVRREMGVFDIAPDESYDDYLFATYEWHVEAAREQVERAERLMRDVLMEGADETSEAYTRAFNEVAKAHLQLFKAEAIFDEEQARRASEKAADEWYGAFEDAHNQFWADFLGEDAFGAISGTAVERGIAEAMGEDVGAAYELDRQMRAVNDAIREYELLGLGADTAEIRELLDMLRDLRVELDEEHFAASMEQIRTDLEHALTVELEVDELLASVMGDEFDAVEYQWQAVDRAIQDTVRTMKEHGKSAEEIRAAVEGIVDEYSHLASVTAALDPLAGIAADLRHQTLTGGRIGSIIDLDFDPLQHRVNALSQAISRGIERVGGVNDQIAEWIVELDELRDVQRQQATVADLGNASLRGFANGLGSANRAVSEIVRMFRYEAGEGFKFDTASLVQMGVETLMWAFGEGHKQERREARTFAAPDPYGAGGLAAARASQLGLEGDIPALERAVRDAQGFVDHMAGQWWNPSQQHNAAEALRVAREELANAQQALATFDFRPFLGIDPAGIAGAVEQGFDMADMTNLGASLEDVVRNALIRAWTTSEEMLRLQTQFGDLLDDLVTEYMETGLMGDMGELNVVIAAMEERGEAFADVLEELGLSTSDVADEMNRLSGAMYNIPTGFRVEAARFESTSGIPSYGDGGYIPATPGGRIIRVSERGEGEYIVPESKMGGGGPLVIIEKVYAQDGTDFGRKLDRELRRRGLVTTGNPMGGRRR